MSVTAAPSFCNHPSHDVPPAHAAADVPCRPASHAGGRGRVAGSRATMSGVTTSNADTERQRGGRPKGLSDRVRRDVHEAVRDLLVSVGYGALRLEEVAARAGVHKSTLYRQWSSKAQLVSDVLGAGEAAYFPRPDEGSWEADIDALCDALARLFRSPTTVAFVRTRAVANDPELMAALEEHALRDMSFVRLPFERAVARGEIDPDCDVEMLTELIIAPFLARVAVTGRPVDQSFSRSLARTVRRIAATGTAP
jgi:AcrR family transcriptional regulator